MSTPTRMLLILMLLLTVASSAFAQVSTPEKQAEEGEASNTFTTRDQLTGILRGSPSELGTILALDPTLLSNEPFLAGYPELAKFVAENPEVKRNPRFYLAEFQVPTNRRTTFDEFMEGLTILGIFTLVAFALSWLVRTTIEQKRWNRLSRTQNEVHNKILDRFSSSEELLAYIRSPAGTRFLESAPIPLNADPQQATHNNAPFARILWSIQLGVIVVAGALGMLLVSLRLDPESAQGVFSMGVIALFIGLGFIASAAVSIILPRKLGMTPQPSEPTAREMIG
jgi:ABC-type multidrug transport system fused ATPase/permease subunit